jgi:hypothetical protein
MTSAERRASCTRHPPGQLPADSQRNCPRSPAGRISKLDASGPTLRAAYPGRLPRRAVCGMVARMAERHCHCSRVSRTAGAIFAGLVLAVTAGCGGHSSAPHESASNRSGGLQGETVDQILQQARAATDGLRSVHVSGRISGGRVDEFIASPCQAAGTLTLRGAVVHVIRLGNTFYFKAGQVFYQRFGVSNAQRLAGRWRETTVQNAERVGLLSGKQVCMRAFLKIWLAVPASAITKDGNRTVRGKPAITLRDSGNDALYVAATGTPYLLAIALHGGGYVNFSGFNQPVTIKAPRSCPPSSPAVAASKVAIIC